MSYRCDTEVKMIFLFMEINPDVTVTVLCARDVVMTVDVADPQIIRPHQTDGN